MARNYSCESTRCGSACNDQIEKITETLLEWSPLLHEQMILFLRATWLVSEKGIQ